MRIRNLALVTDLTLELGPGYNAISGETGAGKSILIGALNLVLGERADRTLIRAEADQCTVEATFDTAQLDAPCPLSSRNTASSPARTINSFSNEPSPPLAATVSL